MTRPRKPKVYWDESYQEWTVNRDGRTWYGTPDWSEAMGYAIVLFVSQPKDYSDLDDDSKEGQDPIGESS